VDNQSALYSVSNSHESILNVSRKSDDSC